MATTKDMGIKTETVEHMDRLYSRSLFDMELRDSSKLLIKTLVLPLVYTSLLMWACLSLYWGSTLYSSLGGLTVYSINLDDGPFGQQITEGIRKTAKNTSFNNLGWQFVTSINSDEASRQLLLDERAWAVVQGMLF